MEKEEEGEGDVVESPEASEALEAPLEAAHDPRVVDGDEEGEDVDQAVEVKEEPHPLHRRLRNMPVLPG